MVNETIINKIRKLLKLAHDAGATEAEASTAAAMAARLLEEHQLSMASIATEARPQSNMDSRQAKVGLRPRRHVGILWNAASKAFGCQAVIFRATGHIGVYGEATAVACACELAEWLIEQVERIASRDVRVSPGFTHTKSKNDFLLGCSGRVAQRLHNARQQRQDARTTTEIAIIDNAALAAYNYAREQVGELGKASQAINTRRRDVAAYRDGQAAGERVQLERNAQVSHQDTRRLQ